jgi:hypothetical protein
MRLEPALYEPNTPSDRSISKYLRAGAGGERKKDVQCPFFIVHTAHHNSTRHTTIHHHPTSPNTHDRAAHGRAVGEGEGTHTTKIGMYVSYRLDGPSICVSDRMSVRSPTNVMEDCVIHFFSLAPEALCYVMIG